MHYNIFDVFVNGTCISISIFIFCIGKYSGFLDIDFQSVILLNTLINPSRYFVDSYDLSVKTIISFANRDSFISFISLSCHVILTSTTVKCWIGGACLAQSVEHLTLFRFWLRSWFQGLGIEPHTIGLYVECGACLRFSFCQAAWVA